MTNLAKALVAVAAAALAAPTAAQYQYPQQQYPDQQYPQQQYPDQQYPQQYPEQQYPQQQYPQQQYPQQQYPEQQYPSQQYPQTYPGYGYPQQGYGEDAAGAIIDQLLGNRYSVDDRQAIRQCARAAVAQAQYRYGPGYGAYNQGYGYNQQYGQGYSRFEVTAITSVERRSFGLHVRGLMRSRYGGHGGYGYPSAGYDSAALSFRCNVDYRGVVTGVRTETYPRY